MISLVSVDKKMSQSLEAKTDVPDFLSSEYLGDILQKYHQEPALKVRSIKVGPCGAAGDAFASTMYRVEVSTSQGSNGVSKRESLIVKMMPTLQLARDKLGEGSYNVQEKEMETFQKIFPELQKILQTIGEAKNIFPEAIAVDRVRGVLVLEDLAVKKFVMADRKVGLSLEQIKLSLVKLARFHAASMVLMEKNPALFESFDVGMFSRENSAFHDFFSSNMDALINEVSSWNGYETYAEKLRKLKQNMFEYAFRASDNEPGDLKVLTHGDLWLNNFMFSYENHGSLSDAIIVR